jgi:hypothetical protein
MEPTLRKPLGVIAIIAGLVLYAVLVGSFADAISTLPGLVQGIVYLILGIAWVFPLRPVLLWMETGRWSVRK